MNDEKIRKATMGPFQPLNGPIDLAEYDPDWPLAFDVECLRIDKALASKALRVDHVGSTSVPGLAAKPIIDILLVVGDSADESAYVPPLEEAGYMLRIREPEWHEHRMFKRSDTPVNLHVFSKGCVEIDRMLKFRDWIRNHQADRLLYERTKRELALKIWQHVQEYADAKSAVVENILARAWGKGIPGPATPESR